jgi:ubiquinone/menaquinone biosynthesis C-methylase UbiE
MTRPTTYIHGTSAREQQRLHEQAELQAQMLSDNLELHPGERLLEIGCGVGAVLGRIGQAQPEARLSGIDISPEQIGAARHHLDGLGMQEVELVVGDASRLPWPHGHFDRVRIAWVVEHLADPLAVLREARRVLRRGGSLHLTETDYASLRVSPPDAAIEAFLAAFVAHFNRHGDAHVGPRLGPLLEQAGFTAVENQIEGIHLWCPSRRQQLRRFCDYLLAFLLPELPALLMAAADADEARLIEQGQRRLAQLADRDDGSLTICAYQARGSAGSGESARGPGLQSGRTPGGAMEFFDRQWSSYRAIVSHNLMEHREVAEATAAALDHWLARRAAGATPARMVDLGCGDLALLPPLLRRLPLASYCGLDLAPVVLPLAERALGPVPYPTHWQEGDLLAWAQGESGGAGENVDILHSAFAIHHLSDDQKATFLAAARRRISTDGVFVWADVFRNPGESRQAYVERYTTRIRDGWPALDAEQQQHVIAHLSNFDLPADRATIVAAAAAAGWQWRWAWQGAHQAEAVAVLTPA